MHFDFFFLFFAFSLFTCFEVLFVVVVVVDLALQSGSMETTPVNKNSNKRKFVINDHEDEEGNWIQVNLIRRIKWH